MAALLRAWPGWSPLGAAVLLAVAAARVVAVARAAVAATKVSRAFDMSCSLGRVGVRSGAGAGASALLPSSPGRRRGNAGVRSGLGQGPTGPRVPCVQGVVNVRTVSRL